MENIKKRLFEASKTEALFEEVYQISSDQGDSVCPFGEVPVVSFA